MQQRPRPTRFIPLALLTLAAISAQPAHAQLKYRLHGGMLQPTAVADDYFAAGPSLSVDVAKPMGSKLDVLLDLGWDYLNTDDTHPTPVTNLWRANAELEGRLVGDGESGVSVSAFGGGGLTLVRSHKFYLVSQQAKHKAEEGVPYTYDGEHIRSASPAAVGGLRIGAHSPDGIMWWLTGKVNWTKLNQFGQDTLHELSTNRFEPKGLDPISSVVNFSVTLGVGL